MSVVRVKQVEILAPWGTTALVPELPAGTEFSQAAMARNGSVTVYLPGAEDAVLDEIAGQKGAVVGPRVISAADSRALQVALATPDPKYASEVKPLWDDFAAEKDPDRLRSLADQIAAKQAVYIDARFAGARSEVLDMMRQGVEALPPEAPPVVGADVAKIIVGIMLSCAWRVGLALVLSHFGPPGIAFALTTFRADNFDRSNRSLNGDPMSDGLGVWTDAVDGEKIVSNVAVANNAATLAVTYDSSAADYARQRVSLTIVTDYRFMQPEARISSPGASQNAYYATGNATLQTYVTASGSDTLLASAGSAPASGDVLACDADGTSISGLVNGSVIAGPSTDSSVASGKPGMRMYDSGFGAKANNFLVETDTVAANVCFAGVV